MYVPPAKVRHHSITCCESIYCEAATDTTTFWTYNF